MRSKNILTCDLGRVHRQARIRPALQFYPPRAILAQGPSPSILRRKVAKLIFETDKLALPIISPAQAETPRDLPPLPSAVAKAGLHAACG
jgi:hypothetical protein